MKFSNILLLLVLVLLSVNADAAAVHQEQLRRRGSSAHTTHHHAHGTTSSSSSSSTSQDRQRKQEEHDGGNIIPPCPEISCFDSCQGQCLEEGQICVTRSTPTSNGCSTCPIFVRCKKERGGGSGGDSGVACGNTVCPVGQECCNALCGICVQPGNVCIQGCPSPSDSP